MDLLTLLIVLHFAFYRDTLVCEKAREMKCFSYRGDCEFYFGDIC